MLYSDVKNGINDRMGNNYFSSVNTNQLHRAVVQALRDINHGKISDDPKSQPRRRVGYDFQRQETNLTYVSGTEKYSLSVSLTVADLKWIDDVLINSDENRRFTKRTPQYFRRRRGVNNTLERMFAEEYLNGTKYILIYHSESHKLNLIWYSNYLVLSGTTQKAYFSSSTADTESLLIPDEYADCVMDIATGYLYMQDRNEISESTNIYLSRGRETLRSMINALGKYEKKPLDGIDLQSEWGGYE